MEEKGVTKRTADRGGERWGEVSMQHPTQANCLSTSFVAEAERAKTKEGEKSKHSIKRTQKQQVNNPNKASKTNSSSTRKKQ